MVRPPVPSLDVTGGTDTNFYLCQFFVLLFLKKEFICVENLLVRKDINVLFIRLLRRCIRVIDRLLCEGVGDCSFSRLSIIITSYNALFSSGFIGDVYYMSCFYPRQALRDLSAFTKSGKSVVRFIDSVTAKSLAGNPNLMSGLPCGQCTGCRLERSRQWAIRCMNEADLYSSNCFITLTFDEPFLQKRSNPMSLDKSEFQKFMKRFRKDYQGFDSVIVNDVESFPIRYFMCGEYGDLFKRPHYHAIIFNFDFIDKVLEKVKDGFRYYSSASLRALWPYGNNIITDVSFDTCAYVARYIMKKSLGKDSWKNYFDFIDENSGELFGHRIPEYTTMSRRSGIGKAWLDRYLQDVYPRDKIFMRGRGFSRPPKYYDSLYEVINPSDYSRLKQDRVDQALLHSEDSSPERLIAKEYIKLQQIKVLKRNLEF